MANILYRCDNCYTVVWYRIQQEMASSGLCTSNSPSSFIYLILIVCCGYGM